jgi:hypothetical protein
MTKMETEEISYQCSKAQETVNLTFVTKSTYTDGNDVPVRKLILKKDCSGRLICGITPKLSITLWGSTDWVSCEYLCKQEEEKSKNQSDNKNG